MCSWRQVLSCMQVFVALCHVTLLPAVLVFPPSQEVLSAFGFSQYEVNLSTRPEGHIGGDEIWDVAESALKESLAAKGWDYVVDEGGGAFYGPKIDIKIQDAIGRKWQCSTIQLDFNLPER